MKTKTIILASLLLLGAKFTYASDNKTLTKKNTVLIDSNASHDALVIKSTTNCHVQIIDKRGQTVLEQKMEYGTNQLSLKNIRSADYKIVVTYGAFSHIRKLSVR